MTVSEHISVTGTGTAEAVPDLLTMSIGVECRRDDVAAAYAAAGERSGAISSALREHGAQNEDMRTSGLNVRADVLWQDGVGQKVTGYVASATVTVQLRNLDGSSAALAAAVQAGGNDVRLNGLDLGFADPAALRARARALAWEDALSAAQQLAQLAGVSLGPVTSLSEVERGNAPGPMATMQRAAAIEPLSIEAGSVGITCSLAASWGVDPAAA
ncbi:SIMPL domain-containing protein [Pseudarthrobacter sp. PS3-L1]|uniref:SIMPL domain-containing protein n=1 Tax=Pseudarthrobacter sp. PS3-L1 TaxID=3046207 RepID=UPI0024BA347D|nr:SIMPL domain-containing protein [Pseudarthrobacter sp. PS3-L1]MDJ0321924.1 SIMPL domain-containing protein [Pseudarthrobacter sp. PS3-L1]